MMTIPTRFCHVIRWQFAFLESNLITRSKCRLEEFKVCVDYLRVQWPVAAPTTNAPTASVSTSRSCAMASPTAPTTTTNPTAVSYDAMFSVTVYNYCYHSVRLQESYGNLMVTRGKHINSDC